MENEENIEVKAKKQPKNKKEKVKKSWQRELMEWILAFVTAFVGALVIKYFIFTPTLVQQGSMTPTILSGERVIVNRLWRTFHMDLERGQIITFEAPTDVDYENNVGLYNKSTSWKKFFYHEVLEADKISFIKRVIGLPGDTVEITKSGKVYVNDELLDEEYLVKGLKTPQREFNDIVVPEGYVFVMGDNRDGSTDSRAFGCIPISEIEGTVKYRMWPLNKIGKIDK